MSHPNCGLLAGKIDLFFENPTAPTSVELYDSLNFLQQQFYVEQKHFGATANLFTFRQVINNVGPFNAEFKSAGDHEWGRRVAKAGYSQIYAENACIQHPARKTLKQLERKVIRVTDGYEDLRRHKLADGQKLPQDHWPAFLHSIASDLKEPFALTPKILGDSRLTGFIKKLSVTGVMFFAKYVRVIERVRLRLGKLERERL
ncbi:MAG: hypothetical protein HC886_02820 [Leptolyngbyaceae cyanobacterium SM1_1_3]|nr:hypothetical protein [Leptolyngbyaceae cyanobacterium SM1_1_3]